MTRMILRRLTLTSGRLSATRRAPRRPAIEQPSTRGRSSRFERGKLDVDVILGVDDSTIATITTMDLLVGAERVDEAHNRPARTVHVEALLSGLPIEAYILGCHPTACAGGR
jgi:hypothetical protein